MRAAFPRFVEGANIAIRFALDGRSVDLSGVSAAAEGNGEQGKGDDLADTILNSHAD